MKNRLVVTSIVLIGAVLVFSCKDKKKDEEDVPTPEFDRKVMLTNIGNNIIVSNYQVLQSDANAFNSSVTTFNSNPDSANLIALQNAFKKAYNSWQICSVFEFGPGEGELLRSNLNTFPTDTVQIKSNISSGSYDLASAANIDAKGFPAIDYILFNADNNITLEKFTTDAEAVNRKSYLFAVSNEIKHKITGVSSSWTSSYINTFINNAGTDVGSGLGELVNQLNFDFELLKNAKIGIPLGKKTLGTPLPEKTEAYYSGISMQLIMQNIKAIENTYLGRDRQGNDGVGLEDYLIFLDAQHSNGSLSQVIKNQFGVAISKLHQIPDPLSETIKTNPTVVDAAYIELQKLVVLLKTDMPSAMGVLITYQDNDGD